MRVLVTGGAGYIGGTMAHALVRGGHDVVVVDDLSTGHRDAVPAAATFVHASVAEHARMRDLLRSERIEAVLHFAARIQVGESVNDPRRYYEGNVGASIALLDAVLDVGVRHFVLSSTAAVYGDPLHVPIDEAHSTAPVNPYGDTKLAVERMLEAYGHAYGLHWAALRYFNAAGADVSAGLDERHDPESHLIPIVLDVALGRRSHVTVFGDDYDTPDGTCIRDYVHVLDLCDAHALALGHLAAGGTSGAFNLGTGTGHSVAEVIKAAGRVTGRAIQVKNGTRRPGDPPRLVASAERARAVLGWRPFRASLDEIVRDAWTVRSRVDGDGRPDQA
jgi:UDP-glucose 4-epimerase